MVVIFVVVVVVIEENAAAAAVDDDAAAFLIEIEIDQGVVRVGSSSMAMHDDDAD